MDPHEHHYSPPRAHGRVRGFGHFVLHFFEMCMPMCIGWVVGDLFYFALAEQLGSADPFRDWPELSLLVVTFNMTALPWLAHGLMMLAMLVPMLLRLDLYTGNAMGARR